MWHLGIDILVKRMDFHYWKRNFCITWKFNYYPYRKVWIFACFSVICFFYLDLEFAPCPEPCCCQAVSVNVWLMAVTVTGGGTWLRPKWRAAFVLGGHSHMRTGLMTKLCPHHSGTPLLWVKGWSKWEEMALCWCLLCWGCFAADGGIPKGVHKKRSLRLRRIALMLSWWYGHDDLRRGGL